MTPSTLRRRTLSFVIAAAVVLAACWLLPRRPSTAAAAGAAGPLLVVYSGPNFTGRSLEVTGTLADLPVVAASDKEPEFHWNDAIRSLRIVRGSWRFHENGRLNREIDDTPLEALDLSTKAPVAGWSSLLSATSAGPLAIAAVELAGLGLDISSIELVSDQNLPDWAAP